MEIRFTQAEVRYGDKVALHPLTVSLVERRIGVIGLNGSGKTTFARLINGLTLATAGSVSVGGEDPAKAPEAVRRRVGFIFQNPANQIIMPIIREDIAFGPKSHGVRGAELATLVDGVLARFGLADLADRRPHELSGGELQLAALAAVLATRPEIVILDEPTNQLDLKNRAVVKAAIDSLEETAIVISHDLDLVGDLGRVLVFHAGRLAFDGPAIEAIPFYRELALR